MLARKGSHTTHKKRPPKGKLRYSYAFAQRLKEAGISRLVRTWGEKAVMVKRPITPQNLRPRGASTLEVHGTLDSDSNQWKRRRSALARSLAKLLCRIARRGGVNKSTIGHITARSYPAGFLMRDIHLLSIRKMPLPLMSHSSWFELGPPQHRMIRRLAWVIFFSPRKPCGSTLRKLNRFGSSETFPPKTEPKLLQLSVSVIQPGVRQ